MGGKYMGHNTKLDNRTLMLLTVGSYVAGKWLVRKKAVPHRTERRCLACAACSPPPRP